MQGAEITAEVLYSQLMLERLRDPVVARGACMRSAWRAGAASSLPGYARLSDELRIASLTTTCLLLGVIAYNLISCAGWFCPSPSRAGPSRASNSGSSRDLRAPHSTCPVLHSSAGRKPLDDYPLWADSRAHRATRMAPHVIEKAGHEGERHGPLSAGVSLGWVVAEGNPSGRRAVSLAGAAGDSLSTPSERRKGLVARHVVYSGTRGSEDLGPNRESRLRVRRKSRKSHGR